MDEKEILIIGANGQLGLALQDKYPKAQTVDADTLDITDWQAVQSYDWSKVKVILNAAAFTNVDGAESPEGRITAWQVNAVAVSYLSKISLKHDIVLVHVSTEYVFDGTKDLHTEDEPYSPLGVYAQTKAAADITVSLLPKHYIVRTSWVMGAGKNFVRTMLEVGRKGINPEVINDDIGRPTFTAELVRSIDHLLTVNALYDTYNVSNEGQPVSWADLTRKTYEYAGLNNTVTNITSKEYYADKPQAAPRPHNSTFDLSKIQATGFKSHDWEDDLKEYITKEIGN